MIQKLVLSGAAILTSCGAAPEPKQQKDEQIVVPEFQKPTEGGFNLLESKNQSYRGSIIIWNPEIGSPGLAEILGYSLDMKAALAEFAKANSELKRAQTGESKLNAERSELQGKLVDVQIDGNIANWKSIRLSQAESPWFDKQIADQLPPEGRENSLTVFGAFCEDLVWQKAGSQEVRSNKYYKVPSPLLLCDKYYEEANLLQGDLCSTADNPKDYFDCFWQEGVTKTKRYQNLLTDLESKAASASSPAKWQRKLDALKVLEDRQVLNRYRESSDWKNFFDGNQIKVLNSDSPADLGRPFVKLKLKLETPRREDYDHSSYPLSTLIAFGDIKTFVSSVIANKAYKLPLKKEGRERETIEVRLFDSYTTPIGAEIPEDTLGRALKALNILTGNEFTKEFDLNEILFNRTFSPNAKAPIITIIDGEETVFNPLEAISTYQTAFPKLLGEGLTEEQQQQAQALRDSLDKVETNLNKMPEVLEELRTEKDLRESLYFDHRVTIARSLSENDYAKSLFPETELNIQLQGTQMRITYVFDYRTPNVPPMMACIDIKAQTAREDCEGLDSSIPMTATWEEATGIIKLSWSMERVDEMKLTKLSAKDRDSMWNDLSLEILGSMRAEIDLYPRLVQESVVMNTGKIRLLNAAAETVYSGTVTLADLDE